MQFHKTDDLAINHEWVIGFWRYLYIWLTSMIICVQLTRLQQSLSVEPGAWLYKHKCQCDCFAINHEQIVRFWWYLNKRLMFTRQKCWPKVKVTGSKFKVKNAIIETNVLAIDYEQMIGSWWYLFLWLISTSSCVQWSWSATAASSRAGTQFYEHPCPCDCLGYKTWIYCWILMILTKKIHIYETKNDPRSRSQG